MNDILHSFTEAILANNEPVGTTFSRARALHDYFSEHNHISFETLTHDNDVYLPSGKAIGTGGAAHCLLEGTRTAVFIRGIHNAIRDLQNSMPGVCIHILYAGCGPFAALLTPLTTVFSAGEVLFHLMDINETSLAAVKMLYEQLGLGAYVSAYTLADAATYKVAEDATYQLMISETMQHALKKEPQVSIMQNLVPQLPQGGIFIPQEIRISAQLQDAGSMQEQTTSDSQVPVYRHLRDIYTISKEQLNGQEPVSIPLPGTGTGYSQLELLTDIRVYKNEVLTLHNCSLNLPVIILDIKQHPGKTITFWYEATGVPGFRYELN